MEELTSEKIQEQGTRSRERARIVPGALEEKLLQLKRTRSGHKGTLTRLIGDLQASMSGIIDPSKVRDKICSLNAAMENFKTSHDAYHVLLDNELDKKDSLDYFYHVKNNVYDMINVIEGRLDSDHELRPGATLPEVSPLDSVSNVGSCAKDESILSRSSHRSKVKSKISATSSSSSRLTIAAKRAGLEAKAASLKQLQDLEREELLLKQRKESVMLDSEIAAAKAEESVFSNAAISQGDLRLDLRNVASDVGPVYNDDQYKLTISKGHSMSQVFKGDKSHSLGNLVSQGARHLGGSQLLTRSATATATQKPDWSLPAPLPADPTEPRSRGRRFTWGEVETTRLAPATATQKPDWSLPAPLPADQNEPRSRGRQYTWDEVEPTRPVLATATRQNQDWSLPAPLPADPTEPRSRGRRYTSDEVEPEASPHEMVPEASFNDAILDLHQQQRRQNDFFMRIQQQQNDQLRMILEKQQQHTLASTLPQPEVPVFEGDPTSYCSFIRAFESLIEAKTENPSSRLYYLVQYTKGDVQELMKSCLLMPPWEGYQNAKKMLKSRYGHSHKIATACVKKIIEGPVIKANDSEALNKFAVSLTTCKNTLKELNLTNRIENSDTMQKLVCRLPYGLKLKWRNEADKISEEIEREIRIEDIAEFVEKEARAAAHPVFGDISEPRPKNDSSSKNSNRKSTKGFAVQAAPLGVEERSSGKEFTSSQESSFRPTCPLCNQKHWLSQCSQFKDMSLDDRQSFVKLKSLCINCLVSGHFARSCSKKSFCKVEGCSAKHSTFLHPRRPAPTIDANECLKQAQSAPVHPVQPSGDSIGAGTLASSSVGLAILPVKVRAKGQHTMVETYAFLDTGSNTTFCTERLQRQLRAEGVNTSLSLTTLERSESQRNCSLLGLEVFDLNENVLVDLPTVYSVPDLPVTQADVPRQEDIDKWDYLQGVQLPYIDAHVGLMIGCDVPLALQPLEVRKSEHGGPFATRTSLGWVVNGPLGEKKRPRHTANFVRGDEKLNKQFEAYCNMEFNDSAFSVNKAMSRDDIVALDVFQKSAHMVQGHYNIAVPWKSSYPNLPNNKAMAVRRLEFVKKRLVRDPVLAKKYSEFMSDLFEKGYAQTVPEEEIQRDDGAIWYLPHHNVIHQQKPDKTRVVFDCSAKYRGMSLNDCVYQGPDLTNSLLGILTRFRKEPIAFMADIEAMFFQVHVASKDINALRFLWYPKNDLTQEPIECQMLVHLFGGVWSPSCANFALRKTAEDNRHLYDEDVADTVLKNFYVDDCLKSVSTEDRAVRLAKDLRDMLRRGGFNLSKWISNSRKVLDSVPLPERAKGVKNLDLSKDHLPVERALGVGWDTETDKFVFKVSPKVKLSSVLTRRGLLSTLASLYDPLGFVAPVCMKAKCILQELSRRNLDWDEALPDDLGPRWQEWLESLPQLEDLSINRCFTPQDMGPVCKRELHHFSDASEFGYGSVSYLRSIDKKGKIHCAIVQAKSRLAPMKRMTIPRLELAAATLSSRLDRMLRYELDFVLGKSTFWTDSTCVLGYLNNHSKRYQTYVANRVSAILEVSEPSQWLFVDSKSNPADIASRGSSPDALSESELWWKGPDFLSQDESDWPAQPVGVKNMDSDAELKKEVSTCATMSSETFTLTDIFTKFSSWYKLKKSIAWLLRLRANLRDTVAKKRRNVETLSPTKNIQPLSVNEMNAAEVAIITYVQRQAFKESLSALDDRAAKGTLKAHPLYKLDPVIVNGLLCVGGRLKNAQVQDQAKHQVILPKKNHIVDLIIRHAPIGSAINN